MLGCAALVSCGPSKGKMIELAKENLELSVDYPKQLKVIAVSQPDSAFGAGYFTKTETEGMLRMMKVVTDTIMTRTGNMSKFDPNDHYVVSLAERQMRGMSEIHSMILKSDISVPRGRGKHEGGKGEFSGWKVKIDYFCVDEHGIPYRAERWFFIDKEVKQVYKTFELPLP